MRTLITLLLLACFAVTQASAAGCPMAPGPQGQGEAASASTHHAHHAPAPAPEPRHDGERHPPSPVQHLAAGCVLMACGSTAVPPATLSLAVRIAPQPDGIAAGRGFYASPSLATEPPPPRSALRS